jgi:hypothetical protein
MKFEIWFFRIKRSQGMAPRLWLKRQNVERQKIFDTVGINLRTYILIEIWGERGNSEMAFDKRAFDKMTLNKTAF